MSVNTSFTDYQCTVGTTYTVTGIPTPMELTLTSATVEQDNSVQYAFSLLFSGPAPLLPQQTYTLSHPQLGELEIFLVPIQEVDRGFVYQAIFTQLKPAASV
jgi:hypothetical protein